MKEPPANIAASIHARLLAGARTRNEDFNLTLKRYVAERFLYRLGESRHREQFVLKGAMVLVLWGGSLYRATRDLDLAGYASNDADAFLATIKEICAVPAPDDGLQFLPESVRIERIMDRSEYQGFRARLQAGLGSARLDLQIDIGLGNAIEPPPSNEAYPTLLDGPAPRIRAYPREAVIAEKVHAMVVLGEMNSRFKDFLDVFMLSMQFPFSGQVLARSIAATFERRQTPVPTTLPAPLTPDFYADAEREAGWKRYLSRNTLPNAPSNLLAVGEAIQSFVVPPWRALAEGRSFSDMWTARGPWLPAGQTARA